MKQSRDKVQITASIYPSALSADTVQAELDGSDVLLTPSRAADFI